MFSSQCRPRIALCGFGHYGRRVANALREYVVCICEQDTRLVTMIESDFPTVRYHQHIDDIDPDECDLVFEVSNVRSRIGVFDWARKQDKGMVLEKPLTVRERDLTRFQKALFVVDFGELHHPVVIAAKTLLRRLEACPVVLSVFRSNTIAMEKMNRPGFRDGVVGGCMLDKGIHDIAVLFSLSGESGTVELDGIKVNDAVLATPIGGRSYFDDMNWPDGPSDLLSDISCLAQMGGNTVQFRQVASWIGVNPSTLASMPDEIVRRGVWHNDRVSSLSRMTYWPCHCKLFSIEYTSPFGSGMLFGSTLSRPGVEPFLLHYEEGAKLTLSPKSIPLAKAKWCLGLVNAAGNATRRQVEDIVAIHRIAFQIRKALLCFQPEDSIRVPSSFWGHPLQ